MSVMRFTRPIIGALVAASAAAMLVSIGTSAQQAQPVISGTSGQWSHKATVTIGGGRFGTKAKAAPLVWDDASGTNVLNKWDGGWPDRASNSTYNIAYRNPIRGVAPPHSRVGRYLAGAHGESLANEGSNVMVWKAYRNTGYLYLSYWYQIDPNWTFGSDNNHKFAIHSLGSPPYVPEHINYEYNPKPESRDATVKWHIYSSAANDMLRPNPNIRGGAHTWWGDSGTNPVGRWVKHEIVAKYVAGSDGFIKAFDNGRLVLDYQGRTDAASGTSRVEAIGGFARPYNEPSNWRYFADLYMDTTFARVILGNRDSLTSSTKREVQIPTSWSDSSISISVNLGIFKQGETAYLYVVDRNGNVNANGYRITVGGSGSPAPAPAPTPPKAPTGLRVIG